MLLSIVILSYNRPEQLSRILSKFVGYDSDKFNLIIKDDVSPRIDAIEDIYEEFKDKLGIELVLYKNPKNLGYDLNLLNSFEITNAEYVCLLSDDDYIEPGKLGALLSILERREFDLYFTPYSDVALNKTYRDQLCPETNFSSTKDYVSAIYNSILFSGLVFRVSAVNALEKDYDFLSSCIYSQVFVSVSLIHQSNSYGTLPGGILMLGGDGENFFGKNQSAKKSELLSDRTKSYSNLNYQGFLLKVVNALARSVDTQILGDFSREYSKRLIAYGLRVRSNGVKEYAHFFNSYKRSPTPNNSLNFLVLLSIFLVPSRLSEFLYTSGVSLLRKSG